MADQGHSRAGNEEWALAHAELVRNLGALGQPQELGDLLASMLGSPKAIRRMNSYLRQVRPKTAELIVDEALAIRSDIDAWKAKKESEEANAAYNRLLYYGLGTDEDPEG